MAWLKLWLRFALVAGAMLVLPLFASAREAWRGFCEDGNVSIVTSGISSTNKAQVSYPRCQVTVFIHGAGKANIFSDNNGTVLANPFQANLDGSWIFYANDGRYDILTTQGSGLSFTYLDVLLCDPFAVGSVCSGGAGGPHNLLSTTHLDTIPNSPPSRGALVTGQALLSPSGTNPSWALLALGSANFVLTSNGTDAIWAPVSGGCTLPGVTDTAVVSEHPVTVCYDSANWTWNDGASKQNMQAGLTNVVGAASQLTFDFGQSNNLCSTASVTNCSHVYVQGASNSVEQSGNVSDTFKEVWVAGRNNFAAGNIQDSYLIGGGSSSALSNSFDTDATSVIANVMCLTQGCTQGGGGVNAFSGGQVKFALFAGFQNGATASGSSAIMQDVFDIGAFSSYNVSDTSTLSSVFTYGESDNVNSNTNCTLQDFYHLGQFATVTCNASGGQLLHNFNVGTGSTFQTTTATTNQLNTAAGINFTLTNCSHHHMFGEAGTCSGSATATATLGVSAVPEIVTTAGHIALAGHLDQSATGKFAGSCAMGAATTCTFSIAAAFTGTPLCVTSIDAASAVPATANVAKCSVSGTTVTITAGISNSLTWDAVLIGNPN